MKTCKGTITTYKQVYPHKANSLPFSGNSAGQKAVAGYTKVKKGRKKKKKTLQSGLLYPARISFRFKEEIKNFTHKKN